MIDSKSNDLEQVDGAFSKAEDIHPHVDLGDEVTDQVVGGQRVSE